jgi:hypothetical protein
MSNHRKLTIFFCHVIPALQTEGHEAPFDSRERFSSPSLLI